MMNYEKLMNQQPTKLGEMVNSKGQKITFVEHPKYGDEAEIIAVSHDLKMAANSTFFDLDDMTADHREYEPSFENGTFLIGGYEA